MDIHSIRQQLRTRSIYDIEMRVTFYARVSTDSDEQKNSLGNQIGYYEDFIKRNKAWTFVPGYIDEGLSGISTKRRPHSVRKPAKTVCQTAANKRSHQGESHGVNAFLARLL